VTVNDLIALLQASGIDGTGPVVFKDQAGNTCVPHITNFGPVQHLSPAQPTDPAYVQIQLENS